jgi:hypothetical protein
MHRLKAGGSACSALSPPHALDHISTLPAPLFEVPRTPTVTDMRMPVRSAARIAPFIVVMATSDHTTSVGPEPAIVGGSVAYVPVLRRRPR